MSDSALTIISIQEWNDLVEDHEKEISTLKAENEKWETLAEAVKQYSRYPHYITTHQRLHAIDV